MPIEPRGRVHRIASANPTDALQAFCRAQQARNRGTAQATTTLFGRDGCSVFAQLNEHEPLAARTLLTRVGSNWHGYGGRMCEVS